MWSGQFVRHRNSYYGRFIVKGEPDRIGRVPVKHVTKGTWHLYHVDLLTKIGESYDYSRDGQKRGLRVRKAPQRMSGKQHSTRHQDVSREFDLEDESGNHE